jgi:hypothetical protein
MCSFEVTCVCKLKDPSIIFGCDVQKHNTYHLQKLLTKTCGAQLMANWNSGN